MANIGSVAIEIKPTVTLESAVACTYMLNLFLEDNDCYALYVGENGEVHIVRKPMTPSGDVADKLAQMPCTSFAMTDEQVAETQRKIAGLENE